MKHFVTFFLSGMIILLLVANLSAQWEPDVRLTSDPAGSYTSWNNAWCVAADGDTVHVVWYDYRDENWEIYYKRSTDGGSTWETSARLTDNAASSNQSSVTVSGSYVHLVWIDDRHGIDETYYKRSTDGGVTWGTDFRLTTAFVGSHDPSVAVSNLYVHVVWWDNRPGNNEIYYKRSTDGGTNWGTDTRLTSALGESWYPSVAVSGNNIHVVWCDERDGNSKIYYKRSTDAGENWGIDIKLPDDPAPSWASSVAVSDNNVLVVWVDTRDGNNEIYYKRSTDGGTIWGTDTRLTDDPAVSAFPSVASSGSNIHVVWDDYRDGNNEIYYKYSSNGGITWETDIRLTDDPAGSFRPSVAFSGSNVHTVWRDNRDENNEIYYKRNPTGNAVAEEDLRHKTRDLRLFCHPNPFTTSTTITLSLPSIGHSANGVELKIYDVSGKLVKDLSVGTGHLALT